jgi:hypothetical protein
MPQWLLDAMAPSMPVIARAPRPASDPQRAFAWAAAAIAAANSAPTALTAPALAEIATSAFRKAGKPPAWPMPRARRASPARR